MKETLITTSICILLIATGVLISWSGQSNGQHLNALINTLIPLASAFIGAYFAYHLMTNRDKMLAEKEKIQIINKWLLLADHARSSLFTIKNSYRSITASNPYERAACTPVLKINTKPISETYSELSFLLPKKDDPEIHRWSQIGGIRALFENYNLLLCLLEERGELKEELHHKLNLTITTGLRGTTSQAEMEKAIGQRKLGQLIDFTEQIFQITDDSLILFDEFMRDFGNYAKGRIPSKAIEQSGPILSFAKNQPQVNELLKRIQPPDHTILASILGCSEAEAKQRYNFGYQD